MTRLIVIALALASCFCAPAAADGPPSATQPSTQPEMASTPVRPGVQQPPEARPQSLDGTPYPVLRAVNWWEDRRLPQIGQIIGSVPSSVNNGKVFYLSADHSTAQRARKMLGDCGVDARDYDWVTTNVAGADFCLLRLDDGRVSGICLIDNRSADEWGKKAAAIASGGIREGEGFRVGRLNYKLRRAGKWTQEIPAKKDMQGRVSRAASKVTHPAALYIEINPVDWVMATRCSSREVYEACASERVLVGMRPVEAHLAMRNYDLKRIKIKDGVDEDWVWTEDEVHRTGDRVYSSEWGVTVVSERSIKQVVAARAKIRDGRVESFEWAIGE